MFKNFLLRKMLRTQGVPEAQIDTLITMMEKDPDLFKRMAEDIKVLTDKGVDQKTAAMQIFQKYGDDLKKLAQ